MASHVVIRQAVGFVYPAYKSLHAVMTEEDHVIFFEDQIIFFVYPAYKTLHAVMTEDHVIFIHPQIVPTSSSLTQHQHHHLGAIFPIMKNLNIGG